MSRGLSRRPTPSLWKDGGRTKVRGGPQVSFARRDKLKHVLPKVYMFTTGSAPSLAKARVRSRFGKLAARSGWRVITDVFDAHS
jgi:hypothetical protein